MSETPHVCPDDDWSVWVCGTQKICEFAVGIGNQEIVIISAPTDELARKWAQNLKAYLTDWMGDCVVPDHQQRFEEAEDAAADARIDEWKHGDR